MCSFICPYLVIGNYGYKCKLYKMGLKAKDGVPERLEVCVHGGRDKEVPLRETEVLICCVSRSGAHKYVYTASFDGEDFYDRRGDAPSGGVKRWRPLDLPEDV